MFDFDSTVAATGVTTLPRPEQDLPADAQRRDPRSGRLRRRLGLLVMGLAMVVGVPLAGGATANAMTIQNGDLTDVYLGWEWNTYWNGYEWAYEPVTMWSPAYGGGRYHCWYWSGGCWWEQHPWRQY